MSGKIDQTHARVYCNKCGYEICKTISYYHGVKGEPVFVNGVPYCSNTCADIAKLELKELEESFEK